MKQWIKKNYQINTEMIEKRYHISEIVAEVLVKRGLFNFEAMDNYLFPNMGALHDAMQMKDMSLAVDLLEQKIKEKKKIKIIGDYDVDGIMSTYILHRGIELLGGQAGYRIPHRVHDGYGMRDYMAVETYEEGYDTIITCDNGISAASAIAKAKELGLTVILTDHHEVPKEGGCECIPNADAVVDPKQEGCSYPFKNLCGAGIVYKLMAHILQKNGVKNFEQELLPFAAIATVCDVVPLLDENRIIVKYGIDLLGKCRNVGIQALIEALDFKHKISSGDFGFRIGPCINAAGRLEDAALGMELLLETDSQKARKKANALVELNQERKNYTASATRDAVEQIEGSRIKQDRVFVVCLENCHESVAGIVAGRIREKYYRPTLILTKTKEGMKGSGRSITGYHMQHALTECSKLLTEYGGHAMAAGFSLPGENLDKLRSALNEKCQLTQKELTEQIVFDEEVALERMTENVLRQLEWMEPFGEGNRSAVFAKRDVQIVSAILCGNENQIARLKLRDGLRVFRGVDFRCEIHVAEAIKARYGEKAWEQLTSGAGKEYTVDILYQAEINQKYGGVQFQILDCR